LFVFAHSQYLRLDAYNLGTALSLLGLAVGFGVVLAVTRSIVPSFIAHGLINLPMTPRWQGIVMVACVVGAVLVWRRGRDWLKQAFSGARGLSCVVLGLAGASWAVAARRFEVLPQVALGLVGCAVVLHAIERRRNARTAGAGGEKQPRRKVDVVP
jgi:hypothetical protein